MSHAFAKYGLPKIQILLECSECDLIDNEQKFINEMRPRYNCSKIAGRVEMNTETRAKISAANKRSFQLHPERRQKISDAHKGFVLTEEHRAVLRIARVGLKPALGMRHSEETKRKMSLAHTGKKQSEETKKKKSVALMGNKNNLGKRASDEARKRQSVSQLRRYRENSADCKRRSEAKVGALRDSFGRWIK